MAKKITPTSAQTSQPDSKLAVTKRSTSVTLSLLSISVIILSIIAYFYILPQQLPNNTIITPKYDLLHPNPHQLDISHWLVGKQIGKGGYSRVFLGKRTTVPGTAQFLPTVPTSTPDAPLTHPALSNALTTYPSTHAVKIIPKARYFRQAMDPNSKKFTNLPPDFLATSVWSERNSWVAFSSPEPIPYILPLSHIFQDPHALYYLTPLINGGDLDTSLASFGPMNERTIRYYAASIITALEGMHARGYAYKDIKLKNLLLDEEGKLQMTDFGLTRFALKTDPNDKSPFNVKKSNESGDDDVNCVTEGIRGKAGTKSYKAPEVLDGRGHSFPSDFYSLGVVLYKMLTGYKLYDCKQDAPHFANYLRIPKYHSYQLRAKKWRTFGVFEFYSRFQRDLQGHLTTQAADASTKNTHADSLSDVLDYDVQEQLMVKWINRQLGGAWKSNNKTSDKLTAKDLFVDGEGPIFSPQQASKLQSAAASGAPLNAKGEVSDNFAWLSLSDELIDFLTQLTDLNPFFRLGTHNRYYRSWNDPYEPTDDEEHSHQEQNRQNQLKPQPKIPKQPQDLKLFPEVNRNVKHDPTVNAQNYEHTHPALIDNEEFDFEVDVLGLGEYEKVVESEPKKHCFEPHLDITKSLPNFNKRDSVSGKWTGLHEGFVEIKNHPWFKNFDWEKMTEILLPTDPNYFQTQHDKAAWAAKQLTIPGHKKVQFENFDVKNSAPRHGFPPMIDASEDTWDHERFGHVFNQLDFNLGL